jgi:hypothetical protein
MRLAILLSLLSILSVSAATQVDGSIRGTVLADDGAPVADAHVYAEVMLGSKILTVLNENTDDLGIFKFSPLALGEYRVSADKQEAGYLSTRPDVFISKSALTIVLTPGTPTATTIIRFSPKAGVITGWVRDSATGRSIAAHLSLVPTDGPGWSTTGTAGRFKFRLLIPANTPVNFGACAEGYTPWFYADPSDPSRPVPLQLTPGAELKIDIKLQHTLESTQTPCLSGKF